MKKRRKTVLERFVMAAVFAVIGGIILMLGFALGLTEQF